MTFDTEKLIREVENRSAIWDITCDEYCDRDVKRRRWEEITDIMCGENLTQEDKNEFGKSLQKKWKNIRTSFNRELHRRKGAKSGSAALRKSPYVYFEQLQFLKTTTNNTTENSFYEESENDWEASVQARSPTKKKKKTDDDGLVEVPSQSIANREEQESDSDRFFMLSLLDDFRKIPYHRRLSTKIELIDTIRRAQMGPIERHHPSGAGRYSPMSGLTQYLYVKQQNESEASSSEQ